jgi:hypothetical protein
MAVGWRRNGYLSNAARAWLEVVRQTLPANLGDDFLQGPAERFPARVRDAAPR